MTTTAYPDEAACLERLWRTRHSPDGEHALCPKCEQERVFKRYAFKQGRKSWTCTGCGHHIQPTAGTMFHRSSVPLSTWFRAMRLVGGGAPVKQLERELGVAYGTAQRMASLIREGGRELWLDDAPAESHALSPTKKRDLTCECCGDIFQGEAWRKYCSRGCSNSARYGLPAPIEAPEGMKACRHCEQIKPLGDFYRGANRDGHGGTCKDCTRERSGAIPRGLHGTCEARTRKGTRCRNVAGPSGRCAVHDGRNRWERSRVEQILLKRRCRELREEGYTYNDIARVLGISPLTASVYAPLIHRDTVPQSPASRAAIEQEEAARREAEQREREGWREEARRRVAAGELELPWKQEPPERPEKLEGLVAAQQRDDRWQQEQPKWVVSLSAPLSDTYNMGDHQTPTTLQDLISNTRDHLQHRGSEVSEEFRDPYEIVTGTTEHRMREVLGDLTAEQVASMTEDELARVRERVREAGLAPPSVQRSERERLKVITPHRGHAPPPKMGHKQSRHRGRNEASALHKSKGRRFKRQEKEGRERDGWGGVVLPEEIAA